MWSTGTPTVALTHIFCGQIQGNDAEGFHSRPNNKNPRSARAENLIFETNALRCYGKEQVYDAKYSRWIDRPVPSTGYFCFFPEAWSIADTVANIQSIYNHCIAHIDNGHICGRNYNNQGFDVIVFLRAVDAGHEVVSSFATPSQDVYCGVNCNLGNLLQKEFLRWLLSMIQK